MPIMRKKAGPEFEAMEFDGSFESAKAIIAWQRSDFAYWSSNNTMTIPMELDQKVIFRPGDALAKTPDDFFSKLAAAEFRSDYEVVA